MPEAPPSDFSFYIDYKKGEGPASRVFAATHEFILACERIDSELAKMIDSNIETVMMLEDVEAGSIKSFLVQVLRSIDDQALASGEWKRVVGKFLVDAKYLILDRCQSDMTAEDLQSLQAEIYHQAENTGVRHIPSYTDISPAALVQAIKDFEEVKKYLVEGDRAFMIVSEQQTVQINRSHSMAYEEIESLAAKEIKKFVEPSMILFVKKPDYLGTSMWEFRYQNRSLSIRIEDQEWLAGFHARRNVLCPGDALKCRVRVEALYDLDNRHIVTRYFIEKVDEIMENQQDRQETLDFPQE